MHPRDMYLGWKPVWTPIDVDDGTTAATWTPVNLDDDDDGGRLLASKTRIDVVKIATDIFNESVRLRLQTRTDSLWVEQKTRILWKWQIQQIGVGNRKTKGKQIAPNNETH